MATRSDSGPDKPDVGIDVSTLKAESLQLALDDLELRAPADGERDAGARIGKLHVDAKGLEAQLQLNVRLDDLAAIVERVLSAAEGDSGLLELVSGAGGSANGSGSGGESANGHRGGDDDDGIGGAHIAKLAAKAVAHEIGSAASHEAKELGLATTRKVRQLGERRRQRLAERHNATASALAVAEEFGIDLRDVEGTGADGRITVRDVREAAGAEA